jgi:hypothetical protein
MLNKLYIIYVQLIYLTNLIFNSSSAHLIHESSSRVNYQLFANKSILTI